MIIVLNLIRPIIITATCAVVMLSCSSEKDAYLRSLGLEVEYLSAVDSVNIEQYDMFQVRNVVVIDDEWILMSTTKGGHKLLFLNMKTSDHFFAIRKGRGPGEMINGNSLHRYGDGAAFYDSNNATCVKISLNKTAAGSSIAIDTIGVFNSGPSKPVFMTTCGSGGFISGNLTDDKVWYSYYDSTGCILSDIDMLQLDEFAAGGDTRISWMLSSVYTSDPEGKRVCVANVISPSLSFSKVDAGILREYKRYSNAPCGITNGRVTGEFRSAFNGIDSDDKYVYVLYSGNRMRGGTLPSNECRHLIVYDWDGNPVKRYILNRNVCSVHIDSGTLWCASTYPESCVYRFDMPKP